MKTDRELLELAGWISVEDQPMPIDRFVLAYNATANARYPAGQYRIANPLVENVCHISHWLPVNLEIWRWVIDKTDGTPLLQVKTEKEAEKYMNRGDLVVYPVFAPPRLISESRAIVRAAAAIGEGMK